ncbi:hypothetical protein WICPIJ_001810 [Wickerhamomyces pijperi]|uniref:Uncharacterized protein n=1 Tax=Wickerhamomyces pijperi TaxID=599730 RepID=A0A9P8TQD9_WICPI|nr:hypothetical protein WICPIJ_001810 [Wickerhamomyces pijperi]
MNRCRRLYSVISFGLRTIVKGRNQGEAEEEEEEEEEDDDYSTRAVHITVTAAFQARISSLPLVSRFDTERQAVVQVAEDKKDPPLGRSVTARLKFLFKIPRAALTDSDRLPTKRIRLKLPTRYVLSLCEWTPVSFAFSIIRHSTSPVISLFSCVANKAMTGSAEVMVYIKGTALLKWYASYPLSLVKQAFQVWFHIKSFLLFITFHSSADRRFRIMRDKAKWKSRLEWIEMSVTNEYTTENHLMVCLNGAPEYINQYQIHLCLRFQAVFMYLAILELIVFAMVLVVVVALAFIANQVPLSGIGAILFGFWMVPLILYLQNISSNILSAEFYNISLPLMINCFLRKAERIEAHYVLREDIELPTCYETVQFLLEGLYDSVTSVGYAALPPPAGLILNAAFTGDGIGRKVLAAFNRIQERNRLDLHLELTDKEIFLIGFNLKFCSKFALVGYIARFETAIGIIVFMYQKALAQRDSRRELAN